jgi:hypothetical protein
VNLSLVNTDWYIRQLRDLPARPYRPDANAVRLFGRDAGAPPSCSPAQLDSLNAWADRAHRRRPDLSRGRPMCLHTMNDAQIDVLEPQLLPMDIPFQAGTIRHTYRQGTPFYVKDVMVLRIILENIGRRPIFFAMTAGTGNRMGLDKYVLQQGIHFKLFPDTVQLTAGHVPGLFNALLDVERTRVLAWDMFKYARLLERDTLVLEPTDDNIAGNLGFVFMSLGDAYRQLGDMNQMVANYKRAGHLSPNPELQRFLKQLESAGATLPGMTGGAGDSAKAATRPESAAGARPRSPPRGAAKRP